MTDRACAAARDRLSWDTLDAGARDAHVAACPSCRTAIAAMRAVVPTLERQAGPPLDEVARAAGWRRLAPSVDDLVAAPRPAARAVPRLRRALPYAIAAAAGALVVVVTQSRPSSDQADSVDAPALLHPYGAVAPTSRLATAAEQRAMLPFGELALLGPATLETRPAAGVELFLTGGTVLVEIDPDPARPATAVATSRARVEVIGTVFLVRDGGDATEVAVTRGTVHVAALDVHAGEAWSSADPTAIAPISDADRAALDAHVEARRARTRLATADTAPAPAAALAATPRPAPPSAPPPPLREAQMPAPDRAAAPAAVGAIDPIEQLYASAEHALASDNPARARTLWLSVVSSAPEHPLAALARLDLARLAHEQGRSAEAIAHLDAILADGGDRQLVESATRLREAYLGEEPAP